MTENTNFNLKVENISNIDHLISWWKGANHEDQSKFTTLCSFYDYLKILFKERGCGGKFFGIVLLLLIISFFLFFVLALATLIAVISRAADVYISLMQLMLYLYIALIVLIVLSGILILLASMKIIRIVAPEQYQSKYDLFNEAINKYSINVEKLASYCNKKIIEIDDKTKEYQTYWKVFTLTVIPSCFLPLLPSFQNFIFKIYEQENIEDVGILFNALTSYWILLGTVAFLLFFIYMVVAICIRAFYGAYANRKTYHSLFTLSCNYMIF